MMSANPMVVHDATEWQSVADRAAALRDDVSVLADGVAAIGRDGTSIIDGLVAGRAGMATLIDTLVATLRSCVGKLGEYTRNVATSGRRIAAADGEYHPPIAAHPGPSHSWKTLGAPMDSPTVAEDDLPPTIVDTLCPGVWPTVDVAGLRLFATALRLDAQHLAAAADRIAPSMVFSRGRATDAMVERGGTLAGCHVIGDAVRSLGIVADASDAHADAASMTRDEMRTIAARVDTDHARGRVFAALGAEPALVEPAAAGRLALAAAGEDYRAKVDDVGRRHIDQLSNPGASAAAPSGLLGGLGATDGARALDVSRRRARRESAPVNTTEIRRRAGELAQRLPAEIAVRMAVGLLVTEAGGELIATATSDDHDYLRPGITVSGSEWFVGRGGAPELALLGLGAQSGARLVAIAWTTPPPESVRETLTAHQVKVAE
ncbi:hypothetical protein GOEFS_046_00180 [Gordonia effusa NBRC 100432]|uniref:Uncharacterized protein n=1 Tax=Gordonia effusa NBRC 100432 TaxID=1077974 RepID=H0QZ11_9ACTN|nr:hypothetical protein [Gordonia effusa]GAB18062.1 hypothetical protein GOEFS_046_00180 [Gordonia effusa NBRC 100432]